MVIQSGQRAGDPDLMTDVNGHGWEMCVLLVQNDVAINDLQAARPAWMNDCWTVNKKQLS